MHLGGPAPVSTESATARLRAELAELQRRVGAIRQPPSYEEANAKSAAFARADSVARLFGDKASAPLPTESAMAYRKRLVHRFKHHSPRFANESFDQPLSDASMGLVEDIIYSDAAGVAGSASSRARGPCSDGNGLGIGAAARSVG
jgi:hypothetical protein